MLADKLLHAAVMQQTDIRAVFAHGFDLPRGKIMRLRRIAHVDNRRINQNQLAPHLIFRHMDTIHNDSVRLQIVSDERRHHRVDTVGQIRANHLADRFLRRIPFPNHTVRRRRAMAVPQHPVAADQHARQRDILHLRSRKKIHWNPSFRLFYALIIVCFSPFSSMFSRSFS